MTVAGVADGVEYIQKFAEQGGGVALGASAALAGLAYLSVAGAPAKLVGDTVTTS